MKILEVIKLIVFVLVLALLAVWAFVGPQIGPADFQRVDEAAIQGRAVGTKYVYDFTIDGGGAEAGAVRTEANNIVSVFEKRLESLVEDTSTALRDCSVRVLDDNKVRVEMPLNVGDVDTILTQQGKLNVTLNGETVFTEADVKSASVSAYDSETQKIYALVKLNSAAKAKLKELTAGTYSFSLTMDTDAVTGTVSGSEVIRNGELKVGFSASDYGKCLTLVRCLESGSYEMKTSLTGSRLVHGETEPDAKLILLLAGLAMTVVMIVYLLVAFKGRGVAASLALIALVLVLTFFTAAFTWLQITPAAITGLAVALLLAFEAVVISMREIDRYMKLDKDPVSAIDSGAKSAFRKCLWIMGAAGLTGVALWIAGTPVVDFGIAVFGGAVFALLGGPLLMHFLVKTFSALENRTANAKRGE